MELDILKLHTMIILVSTYSFEPVIQSFKFFVSVDLSISLCVLCSLYPSLFLSYLVESLFLLGQSQMEKLIPKVSRLSDLGELKWQTLTIPFCHFNNFLFC